jgi:hypothetical protein
LFSCYFVEKLDIERYHEGIEYTCHGFEASMHIMLKKLAYKTVVSHDAVNKKSSRNISQPNHSTLMKTDENDQGKEDTVKVATPVSVSNVAVQKTSASTVAQDEEVSNKNCKESELTKHKCTRCH